MKCKYEKRHICVCMQSAETSLVTENFPLTVKQTVAVTIQAPKPVLTIDPFLQVVSFSTETEVNHYHFILGYCVNTWESVDVEWCAKHSSLSLCKSTFLPLTISVRLSQALASRMSSRSL